MTETVPVTSTAAFMGMINKVDDCLPCTFSNIRSRELTVSSHSTVTLPIPKSLKWAYKPLLEFDLVMRFPYIPQPFHGTPGTIGAEPAEYPGELLATYPSATMSAGLTKYFPTWSGYPALAQTPINTSDLAMDPHTLLGYGSLFQTITLQQTDGTIIDQMNLEKLPFYNEQRILTMTTDAARDFDYLSGTNIYQHCPDFFPSLVPQRGTQNTRRCNSVTYDAASDTVTVRKKVTLPVPLEFGDSWPLKYLGDTQLILQCNPMMEFTSQPRHHTGTIDLLQQSNHLSTLTAGTASGSSMQGNIQSYQFVTCTNAVLNGSLAGTVNPSVCGERSSLEVSLWSIDVNGDLEDFLGPATSTIDNIWSTSASSPTAVTSKIYPASSIRATGCTVLVSLSQLDIPQINPQYLVSSAGNVLTDDVATNDVTVAGNAQVILDAIGIPTLREVSTAYQVPASQIGAICLSPLTPLTYETSPSVVTASSNLAESLQAADVRPHNINQRKVRIFFNSPLLVRVPIFSADYSSIILAERADELYNAQLVRAPYWCQQWAASTDPQWDLGAEWGATQTVWTPQHINATLTVEVVTNSAYRPKTNARNVPETNLIQSDITVPHGGAQAFPLSTQPISWSIEDLSLRISRPDIPASFEQEFDDAFKGPTGVSVQRICVDTAYKQLATKAGEEITMLLQKEHLYGMQFCITTPEDNTQYGVEPYLNNFGFISMSLFENTTNLFYKTPDQLLTNVGGEMAYTQPCYSSSTTLTDANASNPCTRVKGAGGSKETFSDIDTLFGNFLGISHDSESVASINNPAAKRMRTPLSVFYAFTVGGSATLPRDTKFTIKFVPYLSPEPSVMTPNITNDYTSSSADAITVAAATDETPQYQYASTFVNTPFYQFDPVLSPGASFRAQFCTVVYYRKTWRFQEVMSGSTATPMAYIYS